jgi:hypothetical protein
MLSGTSSTNPIDLPPSNLDSICGQPHWHLQVQSIQKEKEKGQFRTCVFLIADFFLCDLLLIVHQANVIAKPKS